MHGGTATYGACHSEKQRMAPYFGRGVHSVGLMVILLMGTQVLQKCMDQGWAVVSHRKTWTQVMTLPTASGKDSLARLIPVLLETGGARRTH